MSNYAGKISFLANDENGKEKKFVENYLVKAVSFTDAEAKLNSLPSAGQETAVTAISKKKYSDIFASGNHNSFFEGKISFKQEDEKTGKIKTIRQLILIEAVDIQQALDVFKRETKTWIIDPTLEALSLKPYLDILQ